MQSLFSLELFPLASLLPLFTFLFEPLLFVHLIQLLILLIVIVIIILFPREEELIKLLHHFAVRFFCNINMHRVVVNELRHESLLLLVEQATESFEDCASPFNALFDHCLIKLR